MGYTHYFYRARKLKRSKFAAAAAECEAACRRSGVPLAREYNTPEMAPVFSVDEIRFNGLGRDGHETFLVRREYADIFEQSDDRGRLFEFCKTNHKPYDDCVTACLLILQQHFGEEFAISSDGNMDGEAWAAGRRLANVDTPQENFQCK